MKRTILFKMFAGFLVSILLMMSLIFIFYFNTINKYYIQTSKKNLENLCFSLKPNIKQMLNTKNNNKINDYIIQLKKQINTRITIIDKTGKVIADSDANAVNMENHIDRAEIGEALEGEIGDDIRISDTIKEKMIYIAIPLRLNENDSIDYILRLSIYVDNINTLLNKLRIEMLQVSFIVIGIFLIIVLFFYNKISTPIRTLTDASNEVAQGNFDIKIFLKNRDELKDLADNFNYMVMRMKELFNALSNQKEGLNTIIESLQVGLLVLDNQGIIKISNQKLKEIVDIDKVNGQLYWNVLRDFNLNRIIEEVKEKNTLKKEIVVDNKTYLCSTSYIANSEEIVIILSDITEIKRLEKIKKDFVVNVSHELKTPLTAIKGFVETLLEEEQDTKSERRHYLKIIDKHTNRLTNIIDDLLILSKIEEGKYTAKPEKINIKTLIEDSVRIFEDKLREKNLYLKLELEENLPTINADPFKLEQVFINLISNAVRYTKTGEIIIKARQKDEYNIEIIFEDTGIGITKEEHDRIFERFYVVDKSHSRQTGGTGLGLSIVKRIILLHNGTISVNSNLNEGSAFIIEIPIQFSKKNRDKN